MVMSVPGTGKGFGSGSRLKLFDFGWVRTSGASLSTRLWLRLAMSERTMIASRAMLATGDPGSSNLLLPNCGPEGRIDGELADKIDEALSALGNW